jgi:hypothetical protein
VTSPIEPREGQELLAFANDGERRTFTAFRHELEPAGWTIAHNLYVTDRARKGTSVRELDILLIHPRKGLIVVEVKGGELARMANGQWTQNGNVMSIYKQPDKQVHNTLLRLHSALGEHEYWKSLRRRPLRGAMIALPDCDVSPAAEYRLEQSVTFNPDQFIDRRALNREGGVLDAVNQFCDRTALEFSEAPDKLGFVEKILDILSPEFGFSTSFIGDLEVDQARLKEDEELHKDWVLNLSSFQYLHFEAGAGAGKSVVARLRALALADQGSRVLLVCSTSSLATAFVRDVQDQYPDLVLANTIYEALKILITPAKEREQFGMAPDGFMEFEDIINLKDRIPEIARATTARFDAVVVDEVQDIGLGPVNDLKLLLARPDQDPIWTFGDGYQQFRGKRGATAAVDGADTITMRQNHRNSEPIFYLAEGLRSDGVRRFSRKRGVSAREVEYIEYDGSKADQRVVLRETLAWLNRQTIPPHHIAVLSADTTEGNELFTNRQIAKYFLGNPHLDLQGFRIPKPIGELPPRDHEQVIFDSAKRFKGLEAGAVILVDVPDPGELGSEERRVLYAGVTRATTYLSIIATADVIAKLKQIASSRKAAAPE